jgi:outer membrane receptor protein involved in Fe transport
MIAGATMLAFGGMAHAADAAGPLQTASGAGAVSTAATPIKTVTAATDDSSGGTQVTEIVVTGSRIPQANMTSVSPIQAIGHEEFQLQGVTDAIDLLNTLPQNFQNSVADFSNTTNPLTAPGGVSTADLRGQGPQRTLVLVNGRRLGIGDPNTGDPNPAPDLNQIPVALIDHVEVLTGGASATYGSDAVAGVVNFIMKHDFEGVQIDGQVGADQHNDHSGRVQAALRAAGITPPTGSHWDGKNTDFSLVMGANAPDGKGNVTGYFEFRNQEPVTQGQRDYSDCLLVLGPPDACANSSNSNIYTEIADPASGSLPGTSFSVVGTSLLPRPQAGSVPPASFNSSPYEFLSRQDTRYLGGFFAHYDITDWAQPYAEFSFMNDRSTEQVAPSGLFQGGGLFAPGGGFYVNCGNPFLSAQESAALGCTAAQIGAVNQADPMNQKDLLIGRRDIEGPGRGSSYDHTNFRIVIGIKGDFADAWHYDAYGSYYYTSLYNANTGYMSLAGIQNALLVTGTAAAPSCLVGAPCVPYNLFTQGGVNQAQVNSLLEVGTSHGTIEEQIFEGDVTGDLGKYGIKSPWADDGVGLSFGIQNRWDHLVFAPDQAELSGDLSGFAGASVSVDNAIGVQEEYFEARVPIAQKKPWIEDLSIDGGYRYSDYSTSGGVSTFKIGGEWAPTTDIRFRMSYDSAIRAASILEAFTPQSVTNTSAVAVDPCSPTTGAGNTITTSATATLAQCMNTHVTAAQYGNGNAAVGTVYTGSLVQCPAGQCAILQGGNPTLQPEQSNTFSVGATVTPSFLHGFTGSIDYWDIKINGEIGEPAFTTTFNTCLTTGVGCGGVVRTPQGFLFGTTIAGGGYIVGLNANIGQTETSGIDLQGDYRLPLEDIGADGLGSLSFHFVGTYLLTNGLPGTDCAGLFGPTCQTDNPVWRHTASVAWNTPWNVLVRLQWRYLASTALDANNTQVGFGGPGLPGGFDASDARLAAINYLDISGAWRVNSILTIRGGINNLLDQDPPLVSQPISGTGSPNTYPTYDLLGRELFVSATAKF